MQFGATLRNNRAAQVESTLGTSPIIEIRTGPPPANCAAADSGTLLASAAAASDWRSAPSGGTTTLVGTWSDTDANASGTPGHYRVWDSGRTVCSIQGTCTGPSGSGELVVDSDTITIHQVVTAVSFTINEGNA